MHEKVVVPAKWQRGFWSLIITQFQGAFSDNAYKYLLIFMFAAGGMAPGDRDLLVLVVGALFALPFILFSMAGGFLADRYSKRSVTIGTKVSETVVMLVALAGLSLHSLPLQLCAVFLLSSQSAFFGPSKYGLLPELLPERRLSWGNGILELGTFLAIITGTLAGAYMAGSFRDAPHWSGILLLSLALLGLCSSLGISRVPAADPAKKLRINFLGDLASQIRLIRQDRILAYAVLGNTYFFFLAALLQFNIVFFGTDVLLLTESQNGLLQAAVAIGIGIGSVVAGYVSGRKIEYGLIPIGSMGITFFGLLLFRPSLTLYSTAINLCLLGFFAGFFIVPVNALIQHRPGSGERGGVIAAANLLSFVGIFLASGAYYAMATLLRMSPGTIFLTSALLTLGATLYVLILLPDSLLRFLLWLLTHTFYRIRVQGHQNIPEKGGALLVCNHLSLVDALLLMASTDRRIRFIMFKDFYDHPLIHPFARMMQAIPISSKQRPREMIRSLRNASESIRSGRIVCIFAEGQITRIGQLLPFRRGMERIMKGVDAPVIPAHLDGVWGSIFSFEKGRFVWKLPRRIPYRVTISFGKPMPATATAFEVRQSVMELHTHAYALRKTKMKPLQRTFVSNARRHPMRFAMADGTVPKLRAGAALTRSIFLALRLKKLWDREKMVGILLPPSVAGALVNFAALLMGKIPVNLNYTVTGETLASCLKQCGIRSVVTSKAFLERVPLQIPCPTILIEELVSRPGAGEKLKAALWAWLLPAPLLERAVGGGGSTIDSVATIIFSSGSTGDPKGVLLSHYNIASNIDQLGQTFALGKKDRVLGILPFFHSFGFTGTLALPFQLGVGVVYHPNPLDARAIGALVGKYAVTFLLATPTFLQGYIRRCEPEDFGSLDYVLVGAEKLQDRVSQAFEDKFGIRPLEAYGCTECAPAVTVNTRDFRAAGFRQVGGKRGKIGHPLPGVSVKIVNPETMEPLGINEPGLLLVSGPNVMQGYLGRPEKTAEVLKDGWYVTGDIAAIDEDGFISITDRLSRFSKIGGEMVPHVKVEDTLHDLAGVSEQTFAVTGVPDERKGERLVVLHTLPEEQLRPCIEGLAQSGLPNLWIPRPQAFYKIEALPYLGTGKLDLRKIRDLAAGLLSAAD